MATETTLIESLGVPRTVCILLGVFILAELALIWFILKSLATTIKWIFGI